MLVDRAAELDYRLKQQAHRPDAAAAREDADTSIGAEG